MHRLGFQSQSLQRAHGQTLRSLLLAIGALAVGSGAIAQGNPTIAINQAHAYTLDANTAITLDGVPISATDLANAALGFNAQVTAVNVGPNANGGTAVTVALRNLVKGPVTSVDPLRVLNQPVSTTAETVLRDIPGNDLGILAVGDQLEVSGVLDVNNSIVAARVRLRPNPLTTWKLSGLVSGLSGDQFAIGTQIVNFAGVTPLACIPAFQNGQFIEIEAFPNAGYSASSVLNQLISVTCLDPNLQTPPPGTTLVSIEGIVSAMPDPQPDPITFGMLGAQILTSAQTAYRGGAADDLDAGVRIEVTGFYDAVQNSLQANEILFVQPQVRFEAPVASSEVTAGEALTIMGSLVHFTAQTRDQDGIAANGLSATTQVEVRGLVDAAGQLFATRVRERGNPDLNDTRLRGPVSAVNPPNLLLLGVTVDTGSAVFLDANNLPITAAAFFAQVQPGTLVTAENAIYNPATLGMRVGVIGLVDTGLPQPPAPGVAKGTGTAGLSRGTITSFGVDAVFGNDFE